MAKQAKPNPGKEYKEAIGLGVKVRVVVEYLRTKQTKVVDGIVSRVMKTQYVVKSERDGTFWTTFPKAKDVSFRDGAFEYENPGVSRIRVEVIKNGSGSRAESEVDRAGEDGAAGGWDDPFPADF